MTRFKEVQYAKVLFAIIIPAQLFVTIAFLTQIGNHPMTLTSLIVSNVVFFTIYLLFYSMTTTINKDIIQITYGIGLIRKKIKLSQVTSASVVLSPWYYGWGIRFIPNGMLYNISGSAGVELTFSDTSRIIRVGSAQADSLRKIILETHTSNHGVA